LESDRVRKLIDLLYQLYCTADCGVDTQAEARGEAKL
jgi:hypothetical protein